MDENDKKRTNIEDIPRAEDELTDDEAKDVQGGVTKTGPGTLILNTAPPSTTGGTSGRIGGIAVDPSDPSGNT